MGASNEELFRLSRQMIVDNNRSATFAQAYNLSYVDIWDFSSVKQSLKKFEIDLGILHMELDLPWDQPVEEKDWNRVVEYCVNDVKATEAVFEDRKGDYVARQILAELSGLRSTTPPRTTPPRSYLATRSRPAHKEFVYTDLSRGVSRLQVRAGQELLQRTKRPEKADTSMPNRACTRTWRCSTWSHASDVDRSLNRSARTPRSSKT
jgi:hypothetical protein